MSRRKLGPRVRVSVEEYGNSEMAHRFGVRRYPVVFVDEVLFARPKDFGFGGAEDTSGGLYVPWLDPANQRRFKDDLRKAVTRRLAGEKVTGLDVADVATGDDPAEGPATVPSLELKDISGQAIDSRASCQPARHRRNVGDVVSALSIDDDLAEYPAEETGQPRHRDCDRGRLEGR